jgi:predicted tellurium resistance membrane protein TerC
VLLFPVKKGADGMDWIMDPNVWIALVTLTALEIVLGIDNIVFVSILAGKLPARQQRKARLIGLGLAMFMRIGLLFSLTWMMGLTEPLVTVTRYASRSFCWTPSSRSTRSSRPSGCPTSSG